MNFSVAQAVRKAAALIQRRLSANTSPGFRDGREAARFPLGQDRGALIIECVLHDAEPAIEDLTNATRYGLREEEPECPLPASPPPRTIPSTMSENDLRELRALLREAVGVLRRPTRQLEREIGVGNGRLQQLLDGTLELRVHHLLSFARLLRIPPEDLLAYSCSETRAAARHRLPNWLRYLDKNRPDEAASSREPEQLREMIRGVLREELEQRTAAVSEPAPRGRRKSES